MHSKQGGVTTINNQIIIQYWLNGEIPTDVADELEEQCKVRAFSMIQEGYQSGTLCEIINDNDYDGWWHKKEVDLMQPKNETMKEIVKLIGCTEREKAFEMIVNNKYTLESIFEALDAAGMSNQITTMYRIAINNGYIKS